MTYQPIEVPELTRLNVILTDGDRRIVMLAEEINEDERRLFQEVATEARQDIRFSFPSFPSENDSRAFISLVGTEAIGFLVMDRCEFSYRCVWPDVNPEGAQAQKDNPQRWAIRIIWIAPPRRRRGFITYLISRTLVYLDVIPTEVAWHRPFTDEGKIIAAKYGPERVFVV
jgi:hypothetical protein